MSLKQTSAPSAEPVKLAEAKDHLRVDDTNSDDYISNFLIPMARAWCENFTGRQLVQATWEWKLDRFPRRDDHWLLLPKSPVVSVESVQYIDTDGATQTWNAANYQVDTDSEPGRLMPVPEKSWPDEDGDRFDAVTVTFKAGYADSNSPPAADEVPAALKYAMLRVIQDTFDIRGDEVLGVSAAAVSRTAESLATPYRIYWM